MWGGKGEAPAEPEPANNKAFIDRQKFGQLQWSLAQKPPWLPDEASGQIIQS
jgi:hypothetical protein